MSSDESWGKLCQGPKAWLVGSPVSSQRIDDKLVDFPAAEPFLKYRDSALMYVACEGKRVSSVMCSASL